MKWSALWIDGRFTLNCVWIQCHRWEYIWKTYQETFIAKHKEFFLVGVEKLNIPSIISTLNFKHRIIVLHTAGQILNVVQKDQELLQISSNQIKATNRMAHTN